MTKTVLKNEDIVIEEAPQTNGALVKAASEVLIQAPSEMSCEEPFEDNEATDIAVGEYKSNFNQLWLSTFGSSVATGANVLQAIKNDGTLYRLVSNTKLSAAENGLKYGVERGADGAIKGHGKFAKVGGTTAVVASQVLAQGMLIQMSFQLQALQAAVDDIKNDLFESKIDDLTGCVESVVYAITVFGSNGDKGPISSAIAQVIPSFEILLGAVKREIVRIDSKSYFWSTKNWFGKSVQQATAERCAQIGRGLKCLAYSIDTISKGYSICDQRTGLNVAKQLVGKLVSLDLKKLQEDVRGLPYDRWGGFEESLCNAQTTLPTILTSLEKKPVILLPGRTIHSIMENNNGQLS